MLRRCGLTFAGLCLTGVSAFAASPSLAALPPDLLSTVREIQAAYTRKDVEGILSHYAPDCTFLMSGVSDKLHDFHVVGRKTPQAKHSPKRHDLAGERQELQRIWSDPVGSRLSPLSTLPYPVEAVDFTSYVEKATSNRKVTELRLTIEHVLLLYQGQAISSRHEVDEEVWVKGAQGWKLKRRTMDVGAMWTDYS